MQNRWRAGLRHPARKGRNVHAGVFGAGVGRPRQHCTSQPKVFKLYKNPKSENFRGYWRNPYQEVLPDVKNRAEKPDVFLRNRSKQVDDKKKNANLSIRKKQRIIDVKYRFHSCPEMYRINQMIAKLIRDRIAGNITFDPRTEIMPLVLATEVED